MWTPAVAIAQPASSLPAASRTSLSLCMLSIKAMQLAVIQAYSCTRKYNVTTISSGGGAQLPRQALQYPGSDSFALENTQRNTCWRPRLPLVNANPVLAACRSGGQEGGVWSSRVCKCALVVPAAETGTLRHGSGACGACYCPSSSGADIAPLPFWPHPRP